MTASASTRKWPIRPATSLTGVVVGCLAAGLALTGCARSFVDDLPSVLYGHATGATDVLVSIDVGTGGEPLEVSFRNSAEFVLLGDRTAIALAPVPDIFPGPAIDPLRSVMLTEERIQGLFRAADDAGLLEGEIDYGDPGWTHMAYTLVNVTVGGRTISQSAAGLGMDYDSSPELSGGQRDARVALRGFIDTARALVGADSAQYAPTGVVVHRVSPGESNSVDPDLEPDPVPWPITTAPPALPGMNFDACVVVTGPEVPTLLAALDQADELTPWVIGADPPARMAFRPMLADDPGCPE